MKKIFAAFCTLLLLPTLASAELISITELAQEVPEAWIEEIDVNGKTIRIDAPIYVPEVEKLPIIVVSGKSPSDEQVERYEAQGMTVIEKWERGVVLSRKAEQMPENAHVSTYEVINDLWNIERTKYLAEFETRGQERTIADVVERMNTMLSNLFEYETDDIWMDKIQLQKNYISKRLLGLDELKDIEGEDDYIITGRQKIRGIPILLPAPCAFVDGVEECEWAHLSWNEIEFFYKNEKRFRIVAKGIVREEKQLKEDIHVSNFEAIQDSLRTYIQAEKIDEVYSMALGYAVYAESKAQLSKGKNLSEFVLVPTWVVKCRYIEGKKESEINTPGMEADAYDYHNERCFQYLLINAQTGEVYSPKKTGMEKYCMPTIIQ